MENKRYFQWISTDRKGDIMIFDKIMAEDGIIFICFKDGSRINEEFVEKLNVTDVTGKLMAEIESPNNCWQFNESWVGREEERWEQNEAGETVCVQPFIEGRRVFKLIPPIPTNPSVSSFGVLDQLIIKPNETIISDKIIDQTSQKQYQNTSLDPVYIMMSKSKKIDQIIDMELEISLPSIALYNVIKDSFDEGDEKLVNFIIDDISVDKIKDALKLAITSMYNNNEI